MFGRKKIRIDKSVTIWIKKLNVLDFTGCDYVPLIYSYTEPDKSHQRKKDKLEDSKQGIRIVLEKAITKIKSKRISLNEFIDFCLTNDTVLEMVYGYIYTETFKKKIVKQFR